MAETPDLKFDVVIAGGGFAGVYCARALAKEFGEDARRHVALIANQNFMTFQPMLAEVVGSALSPRHVVNPIRRLCRHVTVLRGHIWKADLDARTVTLQAGEFTGEMHIGFEHLVLALGSVVDLSRVPGMAEHAYLLKNVGDALRLRGAIIDRFEEANLQTDPSQRQCLLTFVVVGGGYSGVETAGQIMDLAKEMVEAYPRIPAETLRVVLIHSGSHLLPEISESLGDYCARNLEERGVEIILNGRVAAVTATRARLTDGREIKANTVVCTVGNSPHPLVSELCHRGHIECHKGRIIVDSTLRVHGSDRLWAVGDCAAVPMGGDQHSSKTPPAEGKLSPFDMHTFCPPTAQFAVREGQLLGENLASVLRNSATPLRPFTFTGLGELAAIGHRAAVAEILGMKFSGFFAWWLWRTVYLMKLPGLERKLSVMIEWTLDLFFPRDIALFQPKPTQMLQEMHLEKDDEIFEAGEPARSLYVVKSGRIELLDEEGKVLRTLSAGDQIGKQTLLSNKIWQFKAVAAESTTLVAVSAKVFELVASAGAEPQEVFTRPASIRPTQTEQLPSGR